MTDGLDDEKIVGLCFAMTLCKDEAFEALSGFVKPLPKERLDKIRLELKQYMDNVHRNSLVPKWFHLNYDILERGLIPVIEYVNETLDKQAYNMLTMARVCEMPDDLADLSLLADNLALSEHSEIINGSLCAFSRQKKVSFDDLGETIDFLTLLQN